MPAAVDHRSRKPRPFLRRHLQPRFQCYESDPLNTSHATSCICINPTSFLYNSPSLWMCLCVCVSTCFKRLKATHNDLDSPFLSLPAPQEVIVAFELIHLCNHLEPFCRLLLMASAVGSLRASSDQVVHHISMGICMIGGLLSVYCFSFRCRARS